MIINLINNIRETFDNNEWVTEILVDWTDILSHWLQYAEEQIK